MTPEEKEYARLRADYHAAHDMSPEECAHFLARLRQEDPERATKLKRLLDDRDKSTIELDNRIFEIVCFPSVGEPPPLSPGQILQDRFKIVRLVGSGGMGDVYESIDLVGNQTIALKTLTGEFANDPRALSLLQTEVNLAVKVSGPNVCRIHAYREPKEGSHPEIPFFTMEFLDGITLADKLRLSGPVPWVDVKRIARDICAGLTLIHQEKIVHRDLKPRNIMMVQRSDREHAVVMDFGIAQRTEPPHTEAMAGTIEYMAPEQFEGKAISPATDLFELGVVLYELLTGVPPFPANTHIAALIQRAIPPKPVSSLVKGVPQHWDRVIAKCLAFESGRRYQTAAEVFRALSLGPLYPDNVRRDHPLLFVAVCAVQAAALVWGAYLLYGQLIQPRLEPEAKRWYEVGIAALHEGTYVRAVRSLQRAIEIDPAYPMAHARLAEALEDLDFQSDAQRELLMAMPQEWRLPALDKKRLNAIRATISENNEEGVAAYTQLLRKLPADDQSAGNVDLGMAYERAGNIERALALYGKAAAMDRSSPAPYMHTAVLQSRLLHGKEADQAFETAGRLFAAEMNQEGLAELHYEQGHIWNERYNGQKAKPLLEQALHAAESLPSVQLQVRCLIQLVNADYLISTDDRSPESQDAIERGNQATTLASENGLDSWLADGLVLLANLQLMRQNFSAAETTLDKAMEWAKRTRQPRVQAKANLTLASLRNQERSPDMDKIIGPAEGARDFFQKHGYLALAANSSLLITRAERDQGLYDQAIQSGRKTLDFANSSEIRRLIMQSEETVGSVFRAAERYPEALPHYQRAISFADREDYKGQEMLHYANALWQMGRYEESDEVLNSLPAITQIQQDRAAECIASLLSRRKYEQAKVLAASTLNNYPNLDPYDRKEFEWDQLVARAHLEAGQQALRRLQLFDPPGDKTADAWSRKLQLAEVELAAGTPLESRRDALAAAEFFSSVARYASQLRGIFIAASASRKLMDDEAYKDLSNKAVDISAKLHQNWGPDALRTYLTRPDVQATVAGTNLPLRIQ